MKKLILSLVSLIFILPCFGQKMNRAVKIETVNPGDKKSLLVYETGRSTETIGNYSSTVIEYMIENRTNKILEGEFEFPLYDGESVAGYALDINGVMRKGVAIEKEKGREVFEDVVRRKVDPGLVEMTSGNNFKTRVYPIPANGVRHLEITVEKEIEDKSSVDKLFLQTTGRNTYFYFYEKTGKSKIQSDIPNTRNLTVLFDVSGSAENRDIEKELDFLKQYSESLGNPKIRFVTFADEIVDSFDIDFARNARSSEQKIRGLEFDGATNLDVIKNFSGREVLLFSDGLSNWGNMEDYSVAKRGGRISTVNSSKSANFGTLKRIAGVNGGMFIDLNELSVKNAVKKVFENPLRVISVDYRKSEMEDVYPAVGTIVDGGVSITGILKSKRGTVKVSLGRNGMVEQVIEKEISSFSYDAEESDKVSRLWAMQKIADLDIDYEENRSEILSLAKKFTVVTKDTSLIVLDSVEDYVRYGIDPPEELRKEYDKLVSRNQGAKKSNESSGVPREVYTKFEEFKKWWSKNPSDFKKVQKKGGYDHGYSGGMSPRVYSERVAPVASSRASESVADVMWEDSYDYEPAESPEVLRNTTGSSGNERITNRTTGGRSASEPVYALEGKGFSSDGMEKGRGNTRGTAATVTLQAWNSNAGYIAVLKKTPESRMYAKYLELKKDYGASPSFFMETADYFIDEGMEKEGMRILSNLAEINLENTDVLRALGAKLLELGDCENSIRVFKNLTKLREEVPQFYRDLAMAYEKNGNYQEAVDALWYVASRSWDSRYSEIQQTALNDMNAIIANNRHAKIDVSAIDKNLMQNFDVGLRIVLTWNTDDCDIDLWVTDPQKEKCYYGHKETQSGGRMSRDFTQGYGPEEFCLKVAPGGKYKIECNYYGNHQQKLLQPVIVQAEVYTNFGRPNQQKQVMTLQLDDVKQTFLIGEIDVK
ncbi:MAG: DUF2135 domain-containing protein [Treponema sp.]|nr:DUF2135 domain-containing protein [Treponema sp.]